MDWVVGIRCDVMWWENYVRRKEDREKGEGEQEEEGRKEGIKEIRKEGRNRERES